VLLKQAGDLGAEQVIDADLHDSMISSAGMF
jgi:hypothetical protein